MPLPWTALPGLIIPDLIKPAWEALTPEQRTCWHFWSLENPRLTNDGNLLSLFGWQGYYSTNAPLAILETPAQLADPPADNTPPKPPRLRAQVWRKTSRNSTAQTLNYATAFLYLDAPQPAATGAIITQTYRRQKKNPRKTTGTRHVKTLTAASVGMISLVDPNGYYSSTAGATKYALIKGRTAVRRPDLPLARLKIVNLDNGQILETTVENPTGGAPKRIRRPRHYP